MKKKSFGGHCEDDNSPASNFDGSTQLADISWIFTVLTRSWMSNSTAFNMVCRKEFNGMKRGENFWRSKALKPLGSGIINGKKIATDVYWKFGTRCNGEPAAFG